MSLSIASRCVWLSARGSLCALLAVAACDGTSAAVSPTTGLPPDDPTSGSPVASSPEDDTSEGSGLAPASSDTSDGDLGPPTDAGHPPTEDANPLPEPSATDDEQATADGDGCPTFDGAYDAIQELIFEKKGCTASACHGDAASGGLDLRADVSYDNLVEVASDGSRLQRVKVGTPASSYLYQKLGAALEPDRYDIQGSPMPLGVDPLLPEQLDAIHMWIYQGAPRTGALKDPASGKDVASLLGACLPDAAPQKIEPLPAPDPDKGLQMQLPLTTIGAGSEHEICVPFAYDFSDQVPAAYKDQDRNVFFVNRNWTRQDPTSHHMVVWQPFPNWDPEADGGTWRCYGGDTPNAPCDPHGGSRDCPGGLCGGDEFETTFCAEEYSEVTAAANGAEVDLIQLLTSGLTVYGMPDRLAAAGSPNEDVQGEQGVYWEVPLKGFGWYNSHAFNLWEEPQEVHAASNFYFADETERRMYKEIVTRNEVPHGTPAFTVQDYCEPYVVPQNHSVAIIFGHTHKRGTRFWVTDASGEMIYENFEYDDPKYQQFTPNLLFDSPDEAERTLTFCATFNNGVGLDGMPDPNRVTRASRMSPPASCTPVACVEGQLGAACETDADCDSSPGAGDGFCDACPITNGTTTENEMFVLNLFMVEPESTPLFPGLF